MKILAPHSAFVADGGNGAVGFLCYLIRVELLLSKSFVLLDGSFLGPLASECKLLRGFFFPLLASVGFPGLLGFPASNNPT